MFIDNNNDNFVCSTNSLPNIMLTGYLNPTGEMIARFSTDPNLNKGFWEGANWKDLGFNIHSFFPDPESYSGYFEIDYQDTWNDFWSITNELKPIAIISFGKGSNSWEIEYYSYNFDKWFNDSVSPFQPTPSPPDDSVPIGSVRRSTLPVYSIEDAINDRTLLTARVDRCGAGRYLCGYMAYLGMWYQSLHKFGSYPCKAAGFIHVGGSISLKDAIKATNITIIETINHLQGDNRPPNKARHPRPANHKSNVDIDIELRWSCNDPDNDPLVYDVYFGNKSNLLKVISKRPENRYYPISLKNNEKYYWKIVAYDKNGYSTEGDLWDFVTKGLPNNPPYTPSNPTPIDGAIDVPVNINLMWEGGDPDGDPVTYDVYFGSIPPFQKVASNISITTFTPGILQYGLTYYWNVVAWDNHGLSASSPSWHFTTIETNKPPSKPTISGTINGKTGKAYSYRFTSIDPDNNSVSFYIDWNDGTATLTGYYASGEKALIAHTYNERGTYTIKAKARDRLGEESDWSDPLVVSMPRNKLNHLFYSFYKFLDQHSVLFQLLDQILKL